LQILKNKSQNKRNKNEQKNRLLRVAPQGGSSSFLLKQKEYKVTVPFSGKAKPYKQRRAFSCVLISVLLL